MNETLELLEEHRLFGGWQQRYRHTSSSVNGPMTFSIYLPPTADDTPPPVLYWLSGLTCNDENFTTKAGAQRIAAELGLVLVMPDTSPRGEAVANDPGYDLGQGAGFYVNATQAPWAAHYRMYDYVSSELPALVREHFNVSDRQSISGHSMGGHGALMLALRHPERYQSASAFAPIVNPSEVPWGRKAFTAIWAQMKRPGVNMTPVICWRRPRLDCRCWSIRVTAISFYPISCSPRAWHSKQRNRVGR